MAVGDMMVRPWTKTWMYLLMLLPASMFAAENPGWPRQSAPFRIADNVYYVGSKDLASYLVVTPRGDILINSSLETSPPLIQKSVEQLGFHFSDIKILLISHSHADHDAGSAEVKRLTGAMYMVWMAMCRWWRVAAPRTSTTPKIFIRR